MDYNRILFPDRAEDFRFNPVLRKGYRIFLKHWPEFISFLEKSYEKVAHRQASYALTVYGEQGVGKTLLADKLITDFEITKTKISEGNLVYEDNNLWHRISGGRNENVELIKQATIITEIKDLSDRIDWVEEVTKWGKNFPNKPKIVILDNSERAYFGASLAGINEVEFFEKKNSSHVATHIAQQFIRLARSDIKGTLFIILGNDKQYLTDFYQSCEKQHKNMVSFHELPLPLNMDKEMIVRINVNRLNPVSYWACIDKSGPDMKNELYQKLHGAATFPESFNAVEEAFTDL